MSSSPLVASLCEPLNLRALVGAPASEYHTATHARQQLVSRAVQETCNPSARTPLAAALAPLLPTVVDALLLPFSSLECDYDVLPEIALDTLVSLLRLLRNLCANEPEFQRVLCDAATADLCHLAARLSAAARGGPPSGKQALIASRALLQLLCNMVTGNSECQTSVWTTLLTGDISSSMKRATSASTSKHGHWRLCNSLALAYDLNGDALAAASLAVVYNCVVKSSSRLEQLMESAEHCYALFSLFSMVSAAIASAPAGATVFAQSRQWVQCLLRHFALTGRIGSLLSHVLAWHQTPRSHVSAARRPPVDPQRYLHGLILVLEQIETMLPGTGTTPMAVMRDDSTWAAAPRPDPAHAADCSADEQIPAAALPAISEAITGILVETLLPQLSLMFASVHKAVCTLSASMRAVADDESESSSSTPQNQALVVDPEWTRLLEQWSALCTTRSAHPALGKTTVPSASRVAPPAASSSTSAASSIATSNSSASAAAVSSVATAAAAVAPTLTDAALQLDAVYLALEAIVCMANAAGCTRLTRRLVLGGLGAAALQLMAAASAIDRAAVEAAQARRSASASAASASPFATPEFRPDETTQGQGASQRAAAVSPPGLKVLALRVLCVLAASDKDLSSARVQDSVPPTALAGGAAAEAASTAAPLSAQLLMQITVARCEAVSLLLQQTAIEADQPYAREWAVLAVRLLSEDAADACSADAEAAQPPAGNSGASSGHDDCASGAVPVPARGAVDLYSEGASKIRAQIEALQLRDVADQAELRRLGLKVSVEAAAAAAASGGAEASASTSPESGASAPKPRVTVRTMTPQERAAAALLDKAARDF